MAVVPVSRFKIIHLNFDFSKVVIVILSNRNRALRAVSSRNTGYLAITVVYEDRSQVSSNFSRWPSSRVMAYFAMSWVELSSAFLHINVPLDFINKVDCVFTNWTLSQNEDSTFH